MTDHKLTDNEIIKALNCCAEAEYCATCLARDFCKGMDSLMENSLALINRQKAEIERLNTVQADMTESLRLAAEANKDMSVELDAMRGAANSYKMHYEETERKYKIAVAEREANVKGFTETLDKQRAEIERLKSENKLLTENDVRNKYPNCVSVEKGRIYTRTLEDYDELIGDISAEAIKEFAWRLKNRLTPYPEAPFCEMVGSLDIDALVEEMTEESK